MTRAPSSEWQRAVLRANAEPAGRLRAIAYGLFAIAFGLCDVAEAIRDHGEATREAAGLQPRPREWRGQS